MARLRRQRAAAAGDEATSVDGEAPRREMRQRHLTLSHRELTTGRRGWIWRNLSLAEAFFLEMRQLELTASRRQLMLARRQLQRAFFDIRWTHEVRRARRGARRSWDSCGQARIVTLTLARPK